MDCTFNVAPRRWLGYNAVMHIVLKILTLCLVLAVAAPAYADGPLLDPELAAAPPARWQRLTTSVMATKFEIILPGDASATAAAREVFELFEDLDARMSEWKPSSPLSAVNRAAGGAAVAVPADLRALLRRCVEIGKMTGGAFDVTWAALWGLWDFKATPPRVPTAAEVRRRAALVDYRQIEIDDRAGTVRLPRAGMMIGFGGIAKGWALDRAAEVLRRHGVIHAMLQSGGQVLALGTQDGKPWRVGLRDPRGGPNEFFATLSVRDESVATSGDYENFFESGGMRYHHILDPRTGWPTRGVRAVVVLSADATLADALGKAPMVLGVQRGLALARRAKVEVLLVDDRGRVHMTEGMRKRVQFLRAPRR